MGIPIKTKNCRYGVLIKSYLWGNKCVWVGQDLFVLGKMYKVSGKQMLVAQERRLCMIDLGAPGYCRRHHTDCCGKLELSEDVLHECKS